MAKTQSKAKEEAAPQDSAGRVWPFEEIAPDAADPPWAGGATITAAQLEELRLRAGRQDYKNVIQALIDHGAITVV